MTHGCSYSIPIHSICNGLQFAQMDFDLMECDSYMLLLVARLFDETTEIFLVVFYLASELRCSAIPLGEHN